MATRAAGNAKKESLHKSGLVRVVDNVPTTRGLGVALRRHGRMEILRSGTGRGGTVVFEMRERYVDPAFLQRANQGGAPWKTTAGVRQAGWSVMPTGGKIAWPAERNPETPPPPISRLPNRNATSVPPAEWAGLGLNCAGMAVAWVGVVGAGLLAPVTGGVTGYAAVLLYAGAIAGTGQCMASVYRIDNVRRGRGDINDKLDASPIYKWTMLGADGVGLLGAKGGIKAAATTVRAVRGSGVGFGNAAARAINRSARADLTLRLGLNARVVGTRLISRTVKLQLLEGAGAVLGIVSSAQGGVIREAIVWVVTDIQD